MARLSLNDAVLDAANKYIDGTSTPVTGTVTVNSIATAGSTQQGAIANPAYTDVTGAATGTMIALLKGIFVQLAQINAKTPTLP